MNKPTDAQAIALVAAHLPTAIRDAKPVRMCVHARRTFDGDGIDVCHEGFIMWRRPNDDVACGTVYGVHRIVIRCNGATGHVPRPDVCNGEYCLTREGAQERYDGYVASRPVDADVRFYTEQEAFDPGRRGS